MENDVYTKTFLPGINKPFSQQTFELMTQQEKHKST